MRPFIWLSRGGRVWLELTEDDNGTIPISRIAARTRLRRDSLTVGWVGIYEGTTTEDIRSILGSTSGSVQELALPVDGDALPVQELVLPVDGYALPPGAAAAA
ncbi:hypothetical protein KC19_12G063800 [Ceratodon purpureus]|uniref:Uncharacterized protein n=1 Tax=Ceratodon purpureus TaxID=3225 RepID=A0A8T0G5F8_CERPU|nr:hypothetical protein KC19_12G063800 [Ceratodon purpureus]